MSSGKTMRTNFCGSLFLATKPIGCNPLQVSIGKIQVGKLYLKKALKMTSEMTHYRLFVKHILLLACLSLFLVPTLAQSVSVPSSVSAIYVNPLDGILTYS